MHRKPQTAGRTRGMGRVAVERRAASGLLRSLAVNSSRKTGQHSKALTDSDGLFFLFLSFLLANCLAGPELLFPKYFMLQRRLGTIIPTQLQVSPLCSQYVTCSTKTSHGQISLISGLLSQQRRGRLVPYRPFKSSLFLEGGGGVKLSHFTCLFKVISQVILGCGLF